jgi:hypothetical protein
MRPSRALLALVGPLLLAACAARGPGGAPEGQAQVAVTNDLRPQSVVTVRLLSTNGVRRILGNVPPQATRVFSYTESVFSGQYQLVAEATDGRKVESERFNPFFGVQVRWSLFTNAVALTAP